MGGDFGEVVALLFIPLGNSLVVLVEERIIEIRPRRNRQNVVDLVLIQALVARDRDRTNNGILLHSESEQNSLRRCLSVNVDVAEEAQGLNLQNILGNLGSVKGVSRASLDSATNDIRLDSAIATDSDLADRLARAAQHTAPRDRLGTHHAKREQHASGLASGLHRNFGHSRLRFHHSLVLGDLFLVVSHPRLRLEKRPEIGFEIACALDPKGDHTIGVLSQNNRDDLLGEFGEPSHEAIFSVGGIGNAAARTGGVD